jgi:hypothetical protein
MISLLRAEWRKTVGNRWVTGLLVWIFPLGALGLTLLAGLIALLSSGMRELILANPMNWTSQATSAIGFFNNQLGRTFMIALSVVVFAGEYQWGTWKNIIPRRRRTSLILAKVVTLALLYLAAMLAMVFFWTVGQVVIVLLLGGQVIPALSGAVLLAFAGDLLAQGAIVYLAVLVIAGQAALVAMVVRSILAGMLVGIGITLVEPIFMAVSVVVAGILDAPWMTLPMRIMPLYNFDNLTAWATGGGPAMAADLAAQAGVVIDDPPLYSAVVILVWVAALGGLMLFLFDRQDITD